MAKNRDKPEKTTIIIWAAIIAQIGMIYLFTYANLAEKFYYSQSLSLLCESCKASEGRIELLIFSLPFLLVSFIISYCILLQSWPSVFMKNHKILTISGLTLMIYGFTFAVYIQGLFIVGY